MGKPVGQDASAPPAGASAVFGSRLDRAETLAALLREHGVDRGLIGPRELDRLWERHLLNSAVITELIPHGATVVDVGSGAGLPGIPLAIARPDLDIVLLEPMARRVDWLHEVLRQVGIRAAVVRGRAEERVVRDRVSGADVVTARALAPLARLSGWCLPLVRSGGVVLAMKGDSVETEVARDRDAVLAAGATSIDVAQCGTGVVDPPATVVSIVRGQSTAGAPRRAQRSRRSRR